MTKKLTAILLCVVMIFSVTACSSSTSTGSSKDSAQKYAKTFTPDKAYYIKTITTTQKADVETVEVPYTRQKEVTETGIRTEQVATTDDENAYTEDDLITLSVDNSKAVQSNWLGLNSVYQGFIFIPDATKLGRTYTQKMIDRELERIDEMDITLLRSYYEPSYAYVGGDVTDPSSWDFSKNNKTMLYLYQWLEALQERNVIVALNMGWTPSDFCDSHTHTACNADNPFYGTTYSQMVNGYAYWYAESLKWIIQKYGYTNVKYTVNFTEPLYYEYSFSGRVEYTYHADKDVEDRVIRNNPSAAGKTIYMGKIGDKTCLLDAKTCYNGLDENGKKIQKLPNFYDLETGKLLTLSEADKKTARVYTGWDMWLDVVNAAATRTKQNGTRSLVKFVGPDVALGSKIQMSYEKAQITGTTANMEPEDDINWWIDHANNVIDVYSFHYYLPHWPGVGGTGTIYDSDYDMITSYFERFVNAVKKTGKPLWFDEFNYNTDTGENRQHYDDIWAENPFNPNKFAEATISMMNTGVQTGLTWQLFDTVWPYRDSSGDEFVSGIHVIGMAPAMCKSSVPYLSYYGFTLLTKYCGMEGSTVYKCEGMNDVTGSMVKYKKNGKEYQSIIVLNMNFTEKPVDIQLTKSLGGVKMYRYLYNPFDVSADSTATMIDADTCLTGVKSELMDVVPAFSFAIYSTEYHQDN